MLSVLVAFMGNLLIAYYAPSRDLQPRGCELSASAVGASAVPNVQRMRCTSEAPALPLTAFRAAPMTQTRALQVMTADDLEIVMLRTFDAPRRAVFEALCDPEL